MPSLRHRVQLPLPVSNDSASRATARLTELSRNDQLKIRLQEKLPLLGHTASHCPQASCLLILRVWLLPHLLPTLVPPGFPKPRLFFWNVPSFLLSSQDELLPFPQVKYKFKEAFLSPRFLAMTHNPVIAFATFIPLSPLRNLWVLTNTD